MSEHNSSTKKLGWFLCWAVVFADIGTSLYYVPGILYGQVSNLAGLFVIMSSLVFVLLVLKYIEITSRYPEGGGVVTVATSAFGPWFGALGGMFITVDYFLTASISSVSGFAYLNSIVHLGHFVIYAAIIAVVLLGVLNVIGIKESAKVTAVVAVLAFIVDIILVGFVVTQITPEGWKTILSSLGQISHLVKNKPVAILTGFAGSFLAFSGLESISQLSPAMQTPRRKVAGIAMALVVGSILITSPLLTLFSTNLLNTKLPDSNETILSGIDTIKAKESEITKIEAKPKLTTEDKVQVDKLNLEIKDAKEYSERFISELGLQYGGTIMKIAVVLTASILLIFAANTAIIGAYHVFISLVRQKFLPQVLEKHNSKFGTPHWAVALAIIPPIFIIFLTNGDLTLLGELYAFGLLGAFMLSSLGLDVVRWKETKKLNLTMVVGIITTILVAIAWLTNLINKPLATEFGGVVTVVGMIIAYIVHKKSKGIEEEKLEVTIENTAEIAMGNIFVPVFDEYDPKFFEFVGRYAKGENKDIALMYIREFTDVLQVVDESVQKDQEATKFLNKAQKIISKYDVKVHEIYKSTTEIATVINETRSEIKPSMTILSPYRMGAILEFLKGRVTEQVLQYSNGNVLIYTGEGK